MSDADDPHHLAARAGEVLLERLGPHRVAVVLGSGWSSALERIGTTLDTVDASELPGMARPTVEGHRGTWSSVEVDAHATGGRILCVGGRSHLYEGHEPSTVVHGVRAAIRAGCRTVVLTNAAGSLRTDWAVGRTVLISDHLNLTGANPMVGPVPPATVPGRFVDLSDLYAERLRRAAREIRPELAEGVYAGLLGASFETPAEIRMLDTLGADLVGMSTVLEAIAARHLGAEVVGVSLVTNLAAGLQSTVDHLEVLAAGDDATEEMVETLHAVVAASVPG